MLVYAYKFLQREDNSPTPFERLVFINGAWG